MMDEINWITVIVSVIISTITAIVIAKLLLDKMLLELEKSDDKFLIQLNIIKKPIDILLLIIFSFILIINNINLKKN